MRFQLVGADEASVDGAPVRAALDRWREYVDSYVLEHPTEWAGTTPVRAPLLERYETTFPFLFTGAILKRKNFCV